MQHDLYGLEVQLRHTRFEIERTIAARRLADLLPPSPGLFTRLRFGIGQALVLAGSRLAGPPVKPGASVPTGRSADPVSVCSALRSVSGRSIDPTPLHRPAA